ncbi:MAG TPA: Hsp70 family protein, partial [Acidimicrobiales bacterium]
MGYSLGIDIGAATCAAAIRNETALEPCVLGELGSTMPAVALPRADGTTLVGEAADRHSAYEPTLVARTVTSHLDDPGPIVIDGAHHDPVLLTEALVGTVIDRSAPAPGAVPDHVVLTFPLRSGDAPRALLVEAADRVAGAPVTTVPEPVAAVAKLARDRDLGDMIVAVVDFGGSTVDVTLVHRSPEAFDLVGDPVSMEDFGGVDVDVAMLALVEGAIGDVSSAVDPDDRNAMIALRRLRNACRAAKEALSTADAAVVEVALPHARGRVEVTRQALEDAVEDRMTEAADLVLAAIDGAGLLPADLGLVLLTGGSARMPLFSQLVADRTGLPVVVDDAPELTVCLGAALFATVPAGARVDLPPAGAPTPLAGRGADLAAAAPLLGALPPSLFDMAPGGPDAGAGGPGDLVPPPAPNLLDTAGHGPVNTGPVPLDAPPPATPFDTGPVPLDAPPPATPFDTGPVPLDAPPPATPFDTGPVP